MSKRDNKALLFGLGMFGSGITAFIAFGQAIFYAWKNANGTWTAEQAAPLAYGTLAISAIFFVLCIYFIIKLVKLRKVRDAT
ncbi:MAG: hypothetical protein ABW126_10595 [Candidatus Sedimenticola sp. 4PFRAG1]